MSRMSRMDLDYYRGRFRDALRVPLGKLKTERWVPVDTMVCQLVERIRSLRPPTAPKAGRLLLFRQRGRQMLVRRIRAALQDVVATVGISVRIVPHQFRHTYGTEMLRAGVGMLVGTAPERAGALGNLAEGPQGSVHRRRVRKQPGYLWVGNDNWIRNDNVRSACPTEM